MAKPIAECKCDGELVEVSASQTELLEEPVKPCDVIPVELLEDPGFSDGELALGPPPHFDAEDRCCRASNSFFASSMSEKVVQGAEGDAARDPAGDAARAAAASAGSAAPQGPAVSAGPSVASGGARPSLRRSMRSITCLTSLQWGEAIGMVRQSVLAGATIGRVSSGGRRFERCTSFDDPTLKRGLHVGKVLKCFGWLLSSNHGSEETFDLSKPVSDQLDVFISHTWSTRRPVKFLTLAYHFNFRFAVVLALLGDLLMGVLLALRVLPSEESNGESLGTMSFTWYCALTSQLVFVIGLLHGHDVRMLFGLMGPMVFLDKACIHQTNPELQRRGIERLSAYLAFSDEMLIVYTDVYLGRLWTVYELVSMLLLQPAARITVIPTSVVALLCTLQVVLLFVGSSTIVMLSQRSKLGDISISLVLVGLLGVPVLLLIVVMRRWGVERQRIHLRAEAFKIRHAECAVEADRDTVYRNVRTLMRHLDFTPADADQDRALDAFDLLVSEMVPLYLRASCGRSGMPWRCGFCLLPGMFGMATDVALANSISTKSLFYILLGVLDAGAIAPLGLALLSWLSAQQPYLKGPANYAFIFVTWLAAMLFLLAALGSSLYLWLYAAEGLASWMWAVLSAVGVLAFALTVVVYWPVQVSAERQEDLRQTCKQGITQLAALTSARQRQLEERFRVSGELRSSPSGRELCC